MLARRQPVTLQWIRSTPTRSLALILLLNLAIDIGWIWTNPPDLDSGETANWWPIATNLIHGQGYSLCVPRYFPFCGPTNQVTASREPVPVILFAIVAWLTNESFLAAALVEIAIDLATSLGVFFLARRLAGGRTALLAALGWTLYLPARQLLPQVSGDLPAALCVTCIERKRCA